jgi:hypothetical protein
MNDSTVRKLAFDKRITHIQVPRSPLLLDKPFGTCYFPEPLTGFIDFLKTRVSNVA